MDFGNVQSGAAEPFRLHQFHVWDFPVQARSHAGKIVGKVKNVARPEQKQAVMIGRE